MLTLTHQEERPQTSRLGGWLITFSRNDSPIPVAGFAGCAIVRAVCSELRSESSIYEKTHRMHCVFLLFFIAVLGLRALKTVEDFTEFEQRTVYFDGDIVIAGKKGVTPP